MHINAHNTTITQHTHTHTHTHTCTHTHTHTVTYTHKHAHKIKYNHTIIGDKSTTYKSNTDLQNYHTQTHYVV